MQLVSYPNAGVFLDDTQAFLERDEVMNSLLLGTALRATGALRGDEHRPEPVSFAAVVGHQREVLLAALLLPPARMLLAGGMPGVGEGVLTLLAEELCALGWHLSGVLGPEALAEGFVRAWQVLTGQGCCPGGRQRVYALRHVTHPRYRPGCLRLAGADDLLRVASWGWGMNEEAAGKADPVHAMAVARRRIATREVYLWQDGTPVSMAARSRPTRCGITINLVYTPPQHRQQGYATSCVAALSQQLLDEGYGFCTLSVDLANPAANRLYQQIGYTPVGDFGEFIFG